MMRTLLSAATLAAIPLSGVLGAQQLRGSAASVRHQHRVAVRNHLSFLANSRQVRRFVKNELLVPIRSGPTLLVADDVSFAYARSQVRLFLRRLSSEYRTATGERLVVTSLTRPMSRQPENASPLSVHPAGIAVDLRVPARASSRAWLERTLLYLEDRTVLDVTRERSPAHYHVAVFPGAYQRYVDAMLASQVGRAMPNNDDHAAAGTDGQ